MKIFIVNLKKHTQRKEKMQSQANKLGLHIEFIEAVYGPEINDEKLEQIVYDYPNCKLTKGEIGCALSHLFIYEKILKENIPRALILEDDAIILTDKLFDILLEIENIDNEKKPNVFLMNKVESYVKNKKNKKTNSLNIYKAYEASGTHGYIINKTAAKKLLKELNPIKYEADMWGIFRFGDFINLNCIVPHVIDTNDENKSDSFIEKERILLRKERESYRHKLKKKEPHYQFYRIKNLLSRKFIYKIEIIT
ncbi:glycosyltransferase family 25 protein [Xenorhabdus bovienii]|uniref:LPS glycosyltransferase n=1 Tax=Xenorhabdus bovienii str. Intermedium TaxID=1379677 RepID=A0A077QKV7_XENBV|nr:glycosyltransferase family 25 protein [Xenorhabdus bovienii]CDH34204.1 LPS glycosyltransferase [Xenorhabdus bovienii str. Intermedium]